MSMCQFKSRGRRPRVLFEVAFLLIFLKSSSSSFCLFVLRNQAQLLDQNWTPSLVIFNDFAYFFWYFIWTLLDFRKIDFKLQFSRKVIFPSLCFSLRSMQNVFINLADRFSPKTIKQNEKQTPRGLQKKSNLTVSFWRTSVVKYTKSIRFNATCKEAIRIKVNEKEVALPTKIFNVFEYTSNAHRSSFNLIFFLLSIFRYQGKCCRGKFSSPSQNFDFFSRRKILPVL